jgi:hypothetical protein
VLLFVSAACLALALVGPVIQEPSVSWSGAGRQLMLLAAFCIAHRIGSRAAARASVERPAMAQLGRWPLVFLCIGVFGTVLQALGKAASLETISLESAGLLRNERAEQLASARPPASAWWAALGFLAYPAGVVGCCAVLRWYERVRSVEVALAVAFCVGLVAMTVLAGGRGPLFALGAVLSGSAALRVLDGLRAMPSSPLLSGFAALVILGFLGYGMLLWSVRSNVSAMDAEGLLEHAAGAWGMSVRPGVRGVLEPLVGVEGVRIVASTFFYFSQSVAVFERIAAADVPAMLGLYEVDVLAAAYRAVGPAEGGLLAAGNQVLLDRQIYGFFAGAWGGLWIDFGSWGAAIAAAAWGWMAGRSWGAALTRPESPTAFMLPFWLAASGWSFASSPIGFSSAAVLLCWFLAFVPCVGHGARPIRRGSSPSLPS